MECAGVCTNDHSTARRVCGSKLQIVNDLDFGMLPQGVAEMMAVPYIHNDQHPTSRIAPHDVKHLFDQVREMRFPRVPRRPSG